MQGLYTLKAVEGLIEKYGDDSEIFTIEGCLLDSYIITSNKYKTAIIKEVYLNEWSSAYSVVFYNKTPLKYQKIIDLLESENYEKASKLFYAK